jgi:hypothetical protein
LAFLAVGGYFLYLNYDLSPRQEDLIIRPARSRCRDSTIANALRLAESLKEFLGYRKTHTCTLTPEVTGAKTA